ncbi:MAG: DUF3187 family protein [bacterium]
MRKPLFICPLLVLMFLISTPDAFPAEGPLFISNSHPLFLSVGTPPFLSARPEDSFAAHLNYSSTYLIKSSEEWDAEIDLETMLLEFRFTKVVLSGTEISFTIPLISYNSGVLDGFLDWYHDALGFSDYGRSERPLNEFLFRVSHKGEVVIEGESGRLGFGDVQVGIKQPILKGDPYLSLYGYIELPTGDAEHGYGNEDVDWGLLLLIDKDLSRAFTLYLNAGMVFVKSYTAQEEIDLSDYPYAALGLEWVYSESLSANAQVSFQGSPYDTGIREIDGTASILSLAGRYAFTKHASLELSFSEDLNTAGAPDFMIETSYRYTF